MSQLALIYPALFKPEWGLTCSKIVSLNILLQIVKLCIAASNLNISKSTQLYVKSNSAPPHLPSPLLARACSCF